VGEYHESIVDTEATPGQAAALADGLIAWLAEERVILPRLIPCTLDGLGYPPGPNYTVAVVEPEPRWEQFTDDGSPRTDGVSVYTGWRMYPGMGADAVTCPYCGTSIPLCDEDFTPNQTWEELWTVIADRYEDGDGRWPCRVCHRPSVSTTGNGHHSGGSAVSASPSGTGHRCGPSSSPTCPGDSATGSSVRPASSDRPSGGMTANLALVSALFSAVPAWAAAPTRATVGADRWGRFG